jgi:hypothetical protein
VAKVHGDIVANALSGEALDAMFKSLGEAAPLGTNSAQQQKKPVRRTLTNTSRNKEPE